MYLEDLFTARKYCWYSRVSVPVNVFSGSNLPVGIQAYASHFNDEHLFIIGRDIEK